MTEQLYTLADADRELRRRECATHGHDFSVIATLRSNDPSRVRCERCGETWRVVVDEGQP